MTRHSAHISARRWRRQAVSLLAIVSLLVGALMPLAHASAGSAGTLLAAICSPNGIRYVEIALGPAEPEAPHPPDLGALDHCPGCLGGGTPAILPVATVVPLPAGGAPIVALPANPLSKVPAKAGFHPRAPPAAN